MADVSRIIVFRRCRGFQRPCRSRRRAGRIVSGSIRRSRFLHQGRRSDWSNPGNGGRLCSWSSDDARSEKRFRFQIKPERWQQQMKWNPNYSVFADHLLGGVDAVVTAGAAFSILCLQAQFLGTVEPHQIIKQHQQTAKYNEGREWRRAPLAPPTDD